MPTGIYPRTPEHRAKISVGLMGKRNHGAPIGTERLSCRGRVYVKTALGSGNWTARAQVVWEAANGPLPPGHLVHHDNEIKTDDRPENLFALTRSEHARLHLARRTGQLSCPV